MRNSEASLEAAALQEGEASTSASVRGLPGSNVAESLSLPIYMIPSNGK